MKTDKLFICFFVFLSFVIELAANPYKDCKREFESKFNSRIYIGNSIECTVNNESDSYILNEKDITKIQTAEKAFNSRIKYHWIYSFINPTLSYFIQDFFEIERKKDKGNSGEIYSSNNFNFEINGVIKNIEIGILANSIFFLEFPFEMATVRYERNENHVSEKEFGVLDYATAGTAISWHSRSSSLQVKPGIGLISGWLSLDAYISFKTIKDNIIKEDITTVTYNSTPLNNFGYTMYCEIILNETWTFRVRSIDSFSSNDEYKLWHHNMSVSAILKF